MGALCGGLTREQSLAIYREVMVDRDREAMRRLCREDLFFLLVCVLNRPDINRQWLYERVREFEAEPDMMLDLWAREHYKSTIITFGGSLRDIIRDQEITIGIFSHTRPIAKSFLRQLQMEMEQNDLLKDLFPEIFWTDPRREAPVWSLDNGLVVKRKTNPKEATVEAWGLVDGQPTSKHFRLLDYDDVVTRESVSTPEQIQKTTDAWALSLNLGAAGGARRYVGTRYHKHDTWRVILDRGAARERRHPATVGGQPDGEPVLLTREALAKKRREMGPYIFAAQMLQDPTADEVQGFKAGWRADWHPMPGAWQAMNCYLLVDPAGEKKKENDYTVMVVIGLGPDQNYYLIDGVRDRLSLTERTALLFRLHRKYRPLKTGYEKYGKDSDIEHIQSVMDQEHYRFVITPLGGAVAKKDRIRKLIPLFEGGRFFLPRAIYFNDYEGKTQDFRAQFDSEYDDFPVCQHDDVLDAVARIVDPGLAAVFPEPEGREQSVPRARTEYDVLNYGLPQSA